MSFELPAHENLNAEMGLTLGGPVQDLIQSLLIAPIDDLLNRPSKSFRGPLVEFGWRLACDKDGPLTESESKVLGLLSTVVEQFHAASLAVDDIQDDSPTRRGGLSLHRKYGTNVALNAGNWLYFWPFELIDQLDLPLPVSDTLHRACRRTLMRAHYGQALDVGVRIDQIPQNRVKEVVLASLELKSGALMALPMELGAIVGGLGAERTAALRKFGHKFGVALQMYNDIGNFIGNREPEKKMEDLKHRRPTWIWAIAAQSDDFAGFQRAVDKLPEENSVTTWFENSKVLDLAKQNARTFMSEAFDEVENHFSTPTATRVLLPQLKELGARIARSYD